jgi:hypothetical protein
VTTEVKSRKRDADFVVAKVINFYLQDTIDFIPPDRRGSLFLLGAP